MFRKKKIMIFLSFLIILFVLTAYYFLFTVSGSTSIIRLVVSRYVKSEDIKIKNAEGSLSDKLVWWGVVIKDVEWLPEGSILTVAELEANFNFLNVQNSYVRIHNANLVLPGVAKFIFYGNYQGRTLDFNLYSKHINIDGLMNILPSGSKLKNFSGVINDFDLSLHGPFLKPQVSGEFLLKELRHKGFTAANFPGEFNLELKDIDHEAKLYGDVQFKSGKLTGNKTATVALEPSSVIFSGNSQEPSLNFKGNSYVERVKIDIVLKGTPKSPDLKLSSNPSMPKEKLLLMLATGKTWKGVDAVAQGTSLSPALAADFLDYFIFSGSGSQLAQKLGVKDFSIKIDNSSKGLSLKKELNTKTEVSYGVDQSKSKDSKSQATQKLGAGHKLTENISLDAEREIKQNNKNDNGSDKPKEESNVKVKFEKEF